MLATAEGHREEGQVRGHREEGQVKGQVIGMSQLQSSESNSLELLSLLLFVAGRSSQQ